jgi:uncharacterized membrane protein YqiK
MRVFDPFGLIGATISFARAHYYAPGTLLFIALVILAHILVLIALIGTGVRLIRRARDRRAVVALFTPTGTLSTIPMQRSGSPNDRVV